MAPPAGVAAIWCTMTDCSPIFSGPFGTIWRHFAVCATALSMTSGTAVQPCSDHPSRSRVEVAMSLISFFSLQLPDRPASRSQPTFLAFADPNSGSTLRALAVEQRYPQVAHLKELR